MSEDEFQSSLVGKIVTITRLSSVAYDLQQITVRIKEVEALMIAPIYW
jgi:hypothetical protein